MITMNNEMRILKSEGCYLNWKQFSKGFKPVELIYPNVEADVLKVIVELYGENYTEWLEKPIHRLNNYTPHQLLQTKTGSRIIKGYLMRLPQ